MSDDTREHDTIHAPEPESLPRPARLPSLDVSEAAQALVPLVSEAVASAMAQQDQHRREELAHLWEHLDARDAARDQRHEDRMDAIEARNEKRVQRFEEAFADLSETLTRAINESLENRALQIENAEAIRRHDRRIAELEDWRVSTQDDGR